MKSERVQVTIVSIIIAAAAGLSLLPLVTRADEHASALGGGNALSRATIGLSHASSISDLFSHLSFASARGGREEAPPTDNEQNTGGATSTDQSDDTQGGNGAPAPVGNGNASNGGAQAGNGGNGGNGGGASPGGLIRAGSVVSNSTAVNAINTVIIRIGH